MDIEKLIEQLNGYFEGKELKRGAALETATALSTLQTENAQLRGELEYEQEHANAYHEECGQWEAENEKLRAELEQVKREMDTAVEDLRVCSTENRMECQYCLYRTARSFCWDCTDGSNWHWRGQKED